LAPPRGSAVTKHPRPDRADHSQAGAERRHPAALGSGTAAGEPTKAEKNPTLLEVTPPDSRRHLNTAWKLGEVLQKGRIDITPLAKGTGPKS